MIYSISSKDNQKIKHAASLKVKKYREEYLEYLSEGKKSLEMALKAGVVKEIFTIAPLEDIPSEIPQNVIPMELIKKIAFSQNPEGIVFVNKMTNKKPLKMNKIVYLDHISDPGNMGTIIRTAYAFNFDAIVVSEECVDIYNEKVVSASKGAIFDMPIISGSVDEFHQSHTLIVSALTENAQDIETIKKPDSFILVLGNEAHGVTEEILQKADVVTKISISNIDSLNVSVAAGILMNYLK